MLTSSSNPQLQALRDLYLIRFSNRREDVVSGAPELEKPGLTYASQALTGFSLSFRQYKTIFQSRRLRNAVWSTCTVALAQQLCGSTQTAY